MVIKLLRLLPNRPDSARVKTLHRKRQMCKGKVNNSPAKKLVSEIHDMARAAYGLRYPQKKWFRLADDHNKQASKSREPMSRRPFQEPE
jgi:hypothetical protein